MDIAFKHYCFLKIWKAHDGCKELALLTDYEQSLYGLCSFITHYKWTALNSTGFHLGWSDFFHLGNSKITPACGSWTNGINLGLGSCNHTLHPCQHPSAGSGLWWQRQQHRIIEGRRGTCGRGGAAMARPKALKGQCTLGKSCTCSTQELEGRKQAFEAEVRWHRGNKWKHRTRLACSGSHFRFLFTPIALCSLAFVVQMSTKFVRSFRDDFRESCSS